MGNVKEEIAKNLLFYRKKFGYTQKYLADLLGVKHNAISSWENGTNSIDMDTLFNVCNIFNISISEMFGIYGKTQNEVSSEEYEQIKVYRSLDYHGKAIVDFILEKEYERCKVEFNKEENRVPIEDIRTIPYYQRLASAGPGQLVLDGLPDDTVEIPNIPQYKHVGYAIGVNGGSMEPAYFDGDTILVEPTNFIDVGETGIFLVDGKSYVKKKGNNVLLSVNEEYDNIPLTPDARCLGRVIDVLNQSEEYEIVDTMEESLKKQHEKERAILDSVDREALKKGAAAISKKAFKAIDGGKNTI